METPMVTVHDLRVSYGRHTVLHDVSLTVETGEIVSIVGPNGSGKSTLLKTIAGLLRVRRGEATLWGRPLAQLPRREVARKLAFVSPGVPPPTGMTVEDVVSQGRFPHRTSFILLFTEQHQRAVDEALQETALTPLRHRLVTTLSGGECQRVWLAMALAQEPSLLVLDEPTTYLDIAHQLDMLELIARLNRDKGLTVLMALHDLNLAARFSHRLIVLAEGRIAAQGPPAEVLPPALLSQVFEVAATQVQVPGVSAPILHPLQIDPVRVSELRRRAGLLDEDVRQDVHQYARERVMHCRKERDEDERLAQMEKPRGKNLCRPRLITKPSSRLIVLPFWLT